MFDLLRFAKSKPQWQQIPFACVRVRPHLVDLPIARESVAFTCKALGAADFLNIADYQSEPHRGLRNAIERLVEA